MVGTASYRLARMSEAVPQPTLHRSTGDLRSLKLHPPQTHPPQSFDLED